MNSSSAAQRYLMLLALTAGVAAAGYLGYELYPRFDLPAASGVGLFALAVGAGIAAFFSPCAFPLLISLLGRERDAALDTDVRSRLSLGLSIGLGATVLLGLVGIVIAMSGEALLGQITFASTPGRALRLGAGLLLLAFGAMQLNLLPISLYSIEELGHGLLKRQARLRRRHVRSGYAVFGFSYLLAGFG